LRKVTFEENGVEKQWLRTVEHFNCGRPFSAADVLTAIARVREESLSSCTSKETDNFFGEVAGLLNWVEELGWRAGEFPCNLAIYADEEGREVSGMGVAAMRQVRTVEYWK
jgi:hypothetical protein